MATANFCPMCGNPHSLCQCDQEHVARHSVWIRNDGASPAQLLVNGEVVTLLPNQEYSVALDSALPQRG